MNNLLRSQRTLKANLVKAISNFKKTGQAKRTEGYLRGRIANIEEFWRQFLENHDNIYRLQDEESDLDRGLVETYETADLYSEFEEAYFDFLGELQDALAKIQHRQVQAPVPQLSVVPERERLPEKKLPAMELPKFNGDFSTWRKFRESFTAMIHEDLQIPLIQKFQYLRSCLSGEPERLLDLYDVSGENYQAAWSEIVKRYDNKRVLVATHLKALLTQTNVVKEAERELKDLLDSTKRRLHELATLGSPVEHWDQIVICLLSLRLPEETKRMWEQKIASSTNHPSLNTMFEFLEERFRLHEALRDAKPRQIVQFNPKATFKPNRSATYHVKEQENCIICKGYHMIDQCDKLRRANSNVRRKILIKYRICLNCIQRHDGFCTAVQECPVCKQDHVLQRCVRFSKFNMNKKQELIQKHNICENCLRPHSNLLCPFKSGCYKCRRRHHTWLHENAKESRLNPEDNSEAVTATTCATQCRYKNKTHALLATAIVLVKGKDGSSYPLRALVDLGSQSSFISQSAYQALNLKGSPASLNVTGLDEIQVAQATKCTKIKLRSHVTPQFELPLEAYVIKRITSVCPPIRCAHTNWNYIQGLNLADPKFLEKGAIDLLLGVKVYANIIGREVKKGPPDAPVAQKTKLGWILFGEMTSNKPPRLQANKGITCTATTENAIEQLNKQVRSFWESEEVQERQKWSVEDHECEEFYQRTCKRLASGQYEVKIPFKDNINPKLGDSKQMALKRFEYTERKLLRQPEVGSEYRKCLNEYTTLNHMSVLSEEVLSTTEVDDRPVYYLPHHAVIKESSTTTKLRVVFDASAKTSNGRSLNEQMLTGPTLQPKLYATLLKWRKHKFAVTADIEKMYRMIMVNKDDRRYQRILWRNHPTEPLRIHELNTVTFGTSAAPYLAIRTLQQLAKDEERDFPEAAQVTLQDFYVDDVLTGADTVEKAKQLQQQLREMLNRGGFRLRKWAANNNELLNWIPESDREVELPLTFKEEGQIKALGIQWHPGHDHFSYAFKIKEFEEDATTKRKILSQIAKLFDPLGWIAPCIVAAKLILQKLWTVGCSWDQEVPAEFIQEWKDLKNQLADIHELRIPRWVHLGSSQESCQLHGFCDASMAAYAAAVYIRITDKEGKIHISLLTAKSKVAPIKPVTLPRLELCGAVLLSKLLCEVKSDMKLEGVECYSWTDSKIVLSWLKGHPRKWRTYVANRIAEIQEKNSNITWKHVASQDNPADLASRGIQPRNLLQNSLWWAGPQWLKEASDRWPNDNISINDTILEIANTKTMTMQEHHEEIDLIDKFSDYRKLLRVTAYCLRFIHNAKGRNERVTGACQAAEVEQAKIKLIRRVQQVTFSKEVIQLKKSGRVDKHSKIYRLDPFFDEQQVIRVGGRLRMSTLPYSVKHPIILQSKSHLTNIIIDKFHKETLHGGAQLVLNTIRNQFWIINGLNTVKKRIYRCSKCTRYRPQVQQQVMGNLPLPRISQAHPFQNTGIDYAGPISVKMSRHKGAKKYKGYICIFVCMATKAVHIEVASDLTTKTFIAAFRRFVSRRGMCTNVYSDNGTNFIGADKEFRRAFKEVLKEATEATAKEFADKGVTWHFIPPSAPHFGGLWEATVKSIKYHLRRTLGSTSLTVEELNTLLVQIEACLNSRPLQALSADPNCMEALTPGHFLTGRALLQPAELSQDDNQTGIVNRWKYLQMLRQQFWTRWSQEYLLQLQQRIKWQEPHQNIKTGQVVIIKDDKQPPACWQLGRVEIVHPGDDGKVRVVTVRTPCNVMQRPIQKIIPLVA